MEKKDEIRPAANERETPAPDKGESERKSCECVCTDVTDEKDDYVNVPLSARLRSWPVWLALFGSVGIILNSAGVFAKWGLDTDAWNTIVNAVGGILVAFGIVNNPTDRKHF